MKTLLKQLTVIMLALILLLTLVSCAAPQEGETSENEEQVSTADTAQQDEQSDFPITITDQLDRTITIEQQPERLVSGYYVSTSMLISLGLEQNVVGIEAKADTRPIYKLSAPEFLELPNVGTAKEFNLEGCIALTPDLVILPVSLREQTVGLEEVGINVLYVNPENTELLEQAYLMIAKATGTTERANEIIEYSYQSLAELDKKLEGVQQKTVYLAGNSNLLNTAGQKMYQTSMIENASGINVAGDIQDTYWANVSYEQILAYNPDTIVIAAAANYTVEDVLNDANLQNLACVQQGEVYAMPSDIEAWDSPVPSAFLGSLWTASVVYPDLYSFDEFSETAAEFYSNYYDFAV